MAFNKVGYCLCHGATILSPYLQGFDVLCDLLSKGALHLCTSFSSHMWHYWDDTSVSVHSLFSISLYHMPKRVLYLGIHNFNAHTCYQIC